VTVGFGFSLGPIHVSTEHGVAIDNPGHVAASLVHDAGAGIQSFVHDPVGTTKQVLASAKNFAEDYVHQAAGALSLIPGIGTGLSSAIETGLAVLDGGGPLDIAIHAAYGAIPIPPGIKSITDHVLNVLLDFAHKLMAGEPLTDAAIHSALDQVPTSIPLVKSVADSLLHIIVGAFTKHPTQKTFAAVKQVIPPPTRPLKPIPKVPLRAPLPLNMAPPHVPVAVPAPGAHLVPGSPGAPPGATHWTCTPGPGGTWACHWV
jgi:hypothetical protein